MIWSILSRKDQWVWDAPPWILSHNVSATCCQVVDAARSWKLVPCGGGAETFKMWVTIHSRTRWMYLSYRRRHLDTQSQCMSFVIKARMAKCQDLSQDLLVRNHICIRTLPMTLIVILTGKHHKMIHIMQPNDFVAWPVIHTALHTHQQDMSGSTSETWWLSIPRGMWCYTGQLHCRVSQLAIRYEAVWALLS